MLDANLRALISRASKAELMEAVQHAESIEEWEAIDDALMDLMTVRELEVRNLGMALATVAVNEMNAQGNRQCMFLCRLAGELAVRMFAEMPPQEGAVAN